ncbi:hypothetical protein [Lacrimispora indolis]|uniref:hypothetical protein n=1 Tax=Lacrimispora indolis TaxID=69825 RepID=UPI003561769E
MKGDVIFRYQLLTAWGSLICETVVRVTNAGAVISNFADGKKKRLSVSMDVVEQIQNIVAKHEVVFVYNELEYPAMLDGVQQKFVFSIADRKKRLTAWNIGKVHSPHAIFHDPGTLEKVDRPEKAMEVVRLFEEISAVLIRAGVNEQCLRLR